MLHALVVDDGVTRPLVRVPDAEAVANALLLAVGDDDGGRLSRALAELQAVTDEHREAAGEIDAAGDTDADAVKELEAEEEREVRAEFEDDGDVEPNPGVKDESRVEETLKLELSDDCADGVKKTVGDRSGDEVFTIVRLDVALIVTRAFVRLGETVEDDDRLRMEVKDDDTVGDDEGDHVMIEAEAVKLSMDEKDGDPVEDIVTYVEYDVVEISDADGEGRDDTEDVKQDVELVLAVACALLLTALALGEPVEDGDVDSTADTLALALGRDEALFIAVAECVIDAAELLLADGEPVEESLATVD